MGASFMVGYTRAKSESLGFTPGTGMANVGVAPREVRLVLLTIGLIVTGMLGGVWFARPDFFPATLQGGQVLLVVTLGLITILATITTIQRILHVVHQQPSEEQHP